MKLTEKELINLVVEGGFVARKQFDEVAQYAKAEGKDIEEALIERDLITDSHLGRLVAEKRGYQFVEVSKKSIPEEALRLIPELVAKSQQIIAFSRDKTGIHVAMSNPENYELTGWIAKKTGEKVIPYFATTRDIRSALKHYHTHMKEEFDEIIAGYLKEARGGDEKPEDVSIIKLVDALIRYAYENRASDIHIEPREKKIVVRYRIDGILHDVAVLPKPLNELIVSRIKVLSHLRTDEHFSSQDGKFRAEFDEEHFDIRVSVVPSIKGETAVLRLLSQESRRFSLDGLGLGESDLAKINAAAEKPFGMILATGPTGCGKTTTLYAILKILNKPDVNIASIEDPVEYDIEGITQIQVNPKTNLTFASGLRSIVRQDPNIIMVGEIRDEETAGIAINSAMTGHLVLSSLHTVNAATALPRLIDMKIEPFLIASSINVICAQRLIRTTCISCIESYRMSEKEYALIKHDRTLEHLFQEVSGKKNIRGLQLYQGKGCKTCGSIGYIGRTGIFEVLEIGERIRDLIMEKANAEMINESAKESGMTSMFYNGVEKVLKGETTLEELLRVMRE